MLRTDNISRSNPAMDSYFQAIYDNSVCYDWTPNPDTRFFLYHSADDEVVPYFNMEHMRDFLRDKNTTVAFPTIDFTNDIPASDAWFTLDGRRLLTKPTTKGLYIHNGVKVLIK